MSAFWFIRTVTTYEPSIPVMTGNQAEFNRNSSYALSALVGGHGTAGDLVYRATDKAKAGFILCDGSAVSRISFRDLFDEIDISWGAGDGTTTFNLPSQSQLSAFIAAPPPTPAQVIVDGTVSSGTVLGSEPVGGTTGGEVSSGGRPRPIRDIFGPEP